MSAAPKAGAGESQGWMRRHWPKVILSLIVAASFGWLLHKGALPLVPPAASFAQMKWWTVPVALLLWSGVHFLRAIRWTWLLEPIAEVPLRRVLGVSFIGFAAIALLPVRTGEAFRPLLIRREGQLSGWAATGTIAAERIIDGLVLSAMLLAGLSLSTPLSPLPESIGDLPVSPALVPQIAYLALGGFVVAFLIMALFYARRELARRLTERTIGWASPRLATWLADKVEHVAAGLRFLPNLRYTGPFVVVTAAYWLLNAAGTWLLAWGTGFEGFTYWMALVMSGTVAIGLLAPNAPGFFGAYQFSAYAALAVFYPAEIVVNQGAACVFVVYSAQLFITVAGGALGLLLERTGLGEALRAEAQAAKLAPEPQGE